MPRVTSIITPIAHLVGPGKLKVINGRLAYSAKDASPLRLDPAALRMVICYGDVGITDEAMSLVLAHGVEVAWLTWSGSHYRGRLVRADASSTALRLAQHRALADPARRLELARWMVAEKIRSQMAGARHYQRHAAAGAGRTLALLKQWHAEAATAADLAALGGIEGSASAAWFSLLGEVLQPPWTFTRRVRRPPTDPVNALLSLGYTFLLNRVRAQCEALGLEVALGALHEYRSGRPSLACDVMEPLRVPAVDRWVVELCNQGRLKPEEFMQDGQAVRLQPPVFGGVVASWEEHWQRGELTVRLQRWLEEWTHRLRSFGEPAVKR
jgi:CRISPR-associated protein Cas1